MADLKVSVIIELLGGKAKAGVEQFRRDFAAAQESARGEIGKTSRSMRDGAESIGGHLGKLGTLAAGYITIWKGVDIAKQLIAQADAMNMMEGRLRLATTSASSFRVAMQDVRRIADATGQGLQPVANLYGRLATSLKALGGTQQQTAEVTEVVALSLRLSGATAAESSSAILQLSQAFGSGVLRGEEFNAVNEAAPRLMKALADGLNVPVGALRKMAEDGKLTSDVLARVLPQSLAKLREEAAQLPPTVEQAAQRLKNAFAGVVSEWDKNTHATGKIAAGLDSLTKNMDAVTAAVTTLATGGLTALGVAGLAAASALKIVAGGFALIAAGALAGYSLFGGFFRLLGSDQLDAHSKRLALVSDTYSGFAKAIEQANQAGLPELAENLQRMKLAALANPEADLDRALVAATDHVNQILAKFKELADGKKKLAELTAQREKQTAKESIDAQIEHVKRLQQARKQDLDKAIADLKEYQKAAETAYARAADSRLSTADKVRELRRRDMSEEKQQADLAAQAQEKIAAAQRALAEAQAAAARGDVGATEKAAESAEKFAQAAESIGAGLKDTGAAIGIVEQAGQVAAAAATAAGQANEKAAAGTEQKITSLRAELAKLKAELDALELKQHRIKIDAEIAEASANIARIRAELDTLQNKTIEITTVHRSVEEHAIGGPVGMYRGGHLPGYGGGDRIHLLAEAGEFVVRKEAVRYWGMEKLAALNAMRLPRFAAGGLVMPAAASAGAPSAATPGGDEMTVRIDIGGRMHRVRTSRETARSLVDSLRELSRAA
jgi:tape measure domain-containing protein